ncbi:MAG TPA: hypothetical protein VI731_06930 [Bacteroidia bacterium]|nr:hypothetical protein [Bacteroidia bacterium]
MTPFRPTLICTLLLLAVSLPMAASKTIQKEFFLNGNVKSITVTTVTMPKRVDLFSFYKKTKISRIDFDSLTGYKLRETCRITKAGHSDRHCYELYFREVEYDQYGNRVRYQEFFCDKGKGKVKEYRDGELVKVIVQKRRRLLPW